MKYFNLYITLLVMLISCKEENQNTGSTKNTTTQIDSVITNNKLGVDFLTEFYKKYYGEYRVREGIEEYVSPRILKRMDSLTIEDNLILDYNPFIYGQDWDENVLMKSIEIKPLKNKNEYRVSFFKFENNDEERTNIDFLLKNNREGKLLIYSILNDEYLNFKKNANISHNKTKSIIDSWQNDHIEIHITTDNLTYLFNGQCIYAFSVKILNDTEVELIWGEIGMDCANDMQFNETFGLSKELIPQKGKPFAKYSLEKEVVNVNYYYENWVNLYKTQINVKPFMNSFYAKDE
ncbi:DUF3828 domain-containing protein [Cellulophaga sp. E16_2]|uniref:DUF3828 domain-containing protein n=1 Tax=Cellulophaga algicola (strain DSM 14237 / IC166 / ACAM 630) TaxID=688270 RepID=E6XD58_CELAD|nr:MULTISPECIES: DUF3828 domain-containing protein [Cellulophaga]ADV51245.1 hypothetical protein Celal_4001 [Cellulophaga algicola DSM 14237]MBO0593635.1 DUF3828 domain-containing protein [Cellulophaga sp. E16_2]